MSKIWMFFASDHTGDIRYHVAVEAENETEVGKFVKENPDKFKDIYEFMEYCDDYSGKIRKLLYPPQSERQYPDLNVGELLSSIPDDKIVSEFWAYSKDSESTSVNVFCLNKEKICKIHRVL